MGCRHLARIRLPAILHRLRRRSRLMMIHALYEGDRASASNFLALSASSRDPILL